MSRKLNRVRELEHLRTANAKHWLMDDGSYECVISAKPQHYKDKDGKWKDIKPVIKNMFRENGKQGRASFEFGSDGMPFDFVLGKHACDEYKIISDDLALSWLLLGANKAKGRFNGNSGIKYEEVFSDVDLKYILKDAEVKEEIVLKGPEAANSFKFRMETEGLIPVLQPDNSIRWIEVLTGKVKMITRVPVAYDAAGSEEEPGVIFTQVEGGWEYELVLNPAWLYSEYRTWPVTIDPDTEITLNYTVCIDSWIDEANPDTNNGSTSFLNTRTNTSGTSQETLIRFDLSSIPVDAVIKSAELKLYCSWTNSSLDKLVHFCLNNSAWTESGVTWNNAPGKDTSIDIDAYIGDDGKWYTINVLDHVTAWMNGTKQNYGFRIYGGSAVIKQFTSSEGGSNSPSLIITYNCKPTATPTDPTGTSSAPEYINTVTPRLSWSYSDPEAQNQASFQVIIKRASDGVTVKDTGEVASANAYYDVPAATLAEGIKYYWQVRVKDADGTWGDYSTAQYFYTNRAPSATPVSPIGTEAEPAIIANSITPTIDWNFGDPDSGDTQTKYRVLVKRASDQVTIIDTGWVSSSNTQYTVPDATLAYGTTYYWQVQVEDPHGRQSGLTTAQYFQPNRTAGTPTNLSPGGTDIEPTWISTLTPTLTWTHNDPDSDPQQSFQVMIYNESAQLVHDSGEIVSGTSSYAVPAAILAGSQKYYWKVRTKDTGSGLFGNYSDPVYIYTNQAPYPPTGLSPGTGEIFDATVAHTFSWTFQDADAGQGDAQSAYQLVITRVSDQQVMLDTGKVVSGISSHLVSGGTLINGEEYQWKVKTWDSQDQVGAYSSLVSFKCSQPPACSITSPVDTGTYGKGILTVKWSYSDPESQSQAKYQAILKNSDGSIVIEDSGEIAGTDTEYTFSTILENNTQYQVMVVIWDDVGLNGSDTNIFTTDFVPPVAPVISTTPYPDSGYVNIIITNPDDDPLKPGTKKNDLYRRETGGNWIRIARGLPVNSEYRDYAVASDVGVEYKAIGISVDETTAESNIASTEMTLRGVWLHDVEDPSGTIHQFKYDGQGRSVSWEAEGALMQFAGRTRPVMEFGEAEEGKIYPTLQLLKDDPDHSKLQTLIKRKGTICYRDGRGRKMFGIVKSLPFTDEHFGYTTSIEIIETSYSEEV